MRRVALIIAAVFSIFGLAGIFAATVRSQAPSAIGMRCPGELFDIKTVGPGTSPYIELNAGRRKGLFLLDYGTTQSSLAENVFLRDTAGGSDIVVENFSLPTFSSGRFGLSNYNRIDAPAGGQLGIVGTDFLSLLTADFSFRGGRSDVVLSALPCDGVSLRARGLIPVRQSGFFSRDLHDHAATTPNVPVLFVDIGGVSAVAQIDTGYDDRALPPSIDINDALYEKLVGGGVALRRRGVSTIATCHGIVTNDVYGAAFTDVSLRTEEGREIRPLAGVALIRKKSNGCGGIADTALPAAQLGMSIVSGLGAIVFDVRGGLVWVPGHG